jgi:hypothetical protein
MLWRRGGSTVNRPSIFPASGKISYLLSHKGFNLEMHIGIIIDLPPDSSKLTDFFKN